ncbi:hypothetical protein KC357_g2190 [Hortaea werneckii]|nr:hypothetical protein KC357_g2190 [Hortaea werneckii]
MSEHRRVKSADAPNDDQAFRFLDLLPEMRNLVYRELLVWPSNRLERCWPQILRTCRQVNDEAKDIIYTENAAKVKVFIKGMGDYGPDRLFWSLEYRGGRAFDDGDDDIEAHFSENLGEDNFRCSPFLLQQKSVQVDIRLQGDEGDGQGEVGDQFGKDVLWSLSKLGLPATALSIQGLHANGATKWAGFIANCDPGSPGDIMQRFYQAHLGSQRLEDSLDLNKPAINIVTQAAYDEVDRPIQDCRDLYLEGFISLTNCILDHEEEKVMINITERLELWVKTTVQALEEDAEVAKARIDAVIHKVRKVAELPEI